MIELLSEITLKVYNLSPRYPIDYLSVFQYIFSYIIIGLQIFDI